MGASLLAPGARAAAHLQTVAPTVAAAPAPFQGEVFYQIFTRSMRDSNGDRQGDLRGIEQSLPYLRKLGVTSILLTPIQPSPFYHNYFPNRPDGIDPAYGTMNDFRALAEAIHRHGMKLYLDEEFQYVTYDHPWFRSALNNPKSPYSSLFFFRGPNNTQPESAVFGITIAKGFPDIDVGITTLNMNVPRFKTWATSYMLRWVDPNGDGDFSDGVDGFRLDHMMDDLDNKHIDTNLFENFWKPLFAKLRARNPRLTFIAEQWDWGFGGAYLKSSGADAVFAFPLAGAIRSFDKTKIVDAIEKTAAATPSGRQQLIFVENHDTPRIASDDGISPEKLRTAAALSLLLKGTPLIYYGQELGMRGKPRPEYQSDEKDIGDREAFKWSASDEAPGQANWYKSPKTYWTQRFAKDNDGISVQEEDRSPRSLLNYYRRVIALRKTHAALLRGSERILPSSADILAIERTAGSEKVDLISNLSPATREYVAHGRDLLHGRRINGRFELGPYETRIILLDARG